ncbi:MAG: hypothetical protein ACRDTJ_15815, partial [Pseudonocardiaceae bacterium]
MAHFLLSNRRVLRVIWMAWRAREDDPGLRRHCLDDALLNPAMSTISGGMPRWDIFPGQRRELFVQAGLVALDGEQVVAVACADPAPAPARPAEPCRT